MRTGDEVSCSSMQVHIPDPDYTSSERARANFRLAAKIALGFVVLLWLIQLLNGGLDLGLQRFGVHPREFAGLPGILLAPLLVFLLYGSMVWGVFPIQPGVSWETHLAAALIGLALAIALRRLDLPPLKRYAWEDEKDEDEDQDIEK